MVLIRKCWIAKIVRRTYKTHHSSPALIHALWEKCRGVRLNSLILLIYCLHIPLLMTGCNPRCIYSLWWTLRVKSLVGVDRFRVHRLFSFFDLRRPRTSEPWTREPLSIYTACQIYDRNDKIDKLSLCFFGYGNFWCERYGFFLLLFTSQWGSLRHPHQKGRLSDQRLLRCLYGSRSQYLSASGGLRHQGTNYNCQFSIVCVLVSWRLSEQWLLLGLTAKMLTQAQLLCKLPYYW